MVGAKMNRSCEAATGITSEFSEWFELAKAQGLLKLSETEEGLMIQDLVNGYLESFVERGWTLEYLRKEPKQDDVVEYVYNVKS